MSVPCLMIKIWEYSDHVHHVKPDKKIDCKCEKYLNMCINAARDLWDNENYFFFNIALYKFQFHRKKYVVLISTKNESYKEQFIEETLRGERYSFLYCRNDLNSNNFS